ncbi:MAG TPA: AI-2E family transporter [Sphingomonas sp.]|nr:AI-2E family transporter [Sphingomonas sp.]
MNDKPAEPRVTSPGPVELRDPEARRELKRAAIWLGLACAIALVVLLAQPLLIILGGLVFATMLDGGVRLLGRVLPIPRGWRLLIVVLCVIVFIAGTFYLTGMQIAAQFAQLRETMQIQGQRLAQWAGHLGILPGGDDLQGIARQALGSLGKLTSWVGTALGAITTLFMMMVIGLFVAMEPRIYDRGLQWMIPRDSRAEFAATAEEMARTLRRLLAGRLLGMAFEGVITWLLLWLFGVPMALVLGLIDAILAFIPNVGAFITGVLMVAVGFSAGTDTGLAALFTYFVVQTFDGYVLIPMVAKRTVDLPPALTLGAQILASALFGVIGLALADPMTTMIKVALERKSDRNGQAEAA